MPTAQALSWSAVIHLFLASFFMYIYLRELGTGHFAAILAGIVFAYNGHMISWLVNFGHPASTTWMPLMFWGVERSIRRKDWRWSLIGGLAFAIPLLGGNILRTAYTAGAFALFMLYRIWLIWMDGKRYGEVLHILGYSFVTGLFGIGLAAPRLLATMVELYPLTVRTTHSASSSSIPWSQLVRILAPNFYGNPITQNYSGFKNFTETNLYWGIIPLFFIFISLFSKYRRLAWGYTGIALLILLAIYGVSPFSEILSLYPGFTKTFPGRFLHVVAFMGAAAAGLGATALGEKHSKKFYQWLIGGLFLGSLIPLFLSFCLLATEETLFGQLTIYFLATFLPDTSKITLTSQQIGDIQKLAILLLVLMGLILLLKGKNLTQLVKVVIIILVTVDLFLTGVDYLPTGEPDLLFPKTESLKYLETLVDLEPEPIRVLGINSGWPEALLIGDTSSVFGFQSPQGYTSFLLERYLRYATLSNCTKFIKPNIIEFTCASDRFLDALNVKYVYINKAEVETVLSSGIDTDTDYTNFDLVYDGANQIYLNHGSFPRTWIVHNVVRVEKGNQEKVQKLLLSSELNLYETAVIEADRSESLLPNSVPHAEPYDSKSRVSVYQPAYVQVVTELSQPGFLVMSDNNYPGWKAFVDGREEPVYYANLFMRAVPVGAGSHVVEFVYKPQAFLWGLYITGGTILLTVGGLIWRYSNLGRRNKIQGHIETGNEV
jgi:uncharacterized membrane protein YfhO